RDPARRPASAPEVARQLGEIASLAPEGTAGTLIGRAIPILLCAAIVAGVAATASIVPAPRPTQARIPAGAVPTATPEPERTPERREDETPGGVACGGWSCPALDGYTPSCNARNRCAYARAPGAAAFPDHDEWIYVPATAFAMGSAPPRDPEEWPKDETPMHT